MEKKDAMRKKLQDKLKKTQIKKKEEIEEKLPKMVRAVNELDEKASIFYDKGQLKEACENYKALLEFLPKITDLQKTSASNFTFETTVDNTLVNTHHMLGKSYFGMDDFENSSIHFKKAQTKNKSYKYYEIQYYLGKVNYNKQKYDIAETHLRNAINSPEKDESCCLAYHDLAVGLVENKFERSTEENVQTIIKYYSEAIHLFPKEVNFNIGLLYLKENEIDKAIHFLKISANLNHSGACGQLGNIYSDEKYGLNNSEFAILYFEKAAELGSGLAAFNVAYLYDLETLIQRDPQKALFWYQKAIEQKFPAAFYNLGFKYLKGEDVDIDYNKAVELFTKATELDHPPAFSELGMCHQYGWGVPINLNIAKKNYQIAFNKGILQAGNNLAYLHFKQSKSETEPSVKKEYLGKAIDIWKILSEKNHSGASFNLGVMYDFAPEGISRSFEKAEFFYSKAGCFGLSNAFVNLAILYLGEFLEVKNNQTNNNFFLEKFKESLERGQQLSNEQAKKMYEFTVAKGNDYQSIFQKIKKYQHIICVKENKNVMDIAQDIDLTPEERIIRILSASSRAKLDGINLSTAIITMGKLYQQSNFNPVFLALNFKKISVFIRQVEINAEHLDRRGLTNIIIGLAFFSIDPCQSSIAPVLNILCEKITNEIKHLSSTQILSILHAVALFGTKHSPLVALSKCLIKQLIEIRFTTEEAAQLIYYLALLENYWQTTNNKNGLLFEKSIYQTIIKEIPAVNEEMDIIPLNQLHMGLFYFAHILKLDIFNEEKIMGYFTPEVIDEIKVESTPSKKSGLQRQVASSLKKFFPNLEEEYFIGTLPVDVFIKDICIIQIDGPRHFLFDIEKNDKSRTPRDLLCSSISKMRAPEKHLHIPYDEWQSAVKKNTVYDYLKDKFLTIDQVLPLSCIKQFETKKTPALTYSYRNPVSGKPVKPSKEEETSIKKTALNKFS